MSYKELRDQVDRFATALHDMGIKKGDKIALLLLNSPQFMIAYFGALKAGATLTAISPVYVSPEIKYQVEDSGARMLICLDILYDNVEKSGVKLDAVILTSIGEYLPSMKKFMGITVLRAVYQKMAAPPVEIFQKEGFYRFQDLLKKYPPKPPDIKFNIREDRVTLPYTVVQFVPNPPVDTARLIALMQLSKTMRLAGPERMRIDEKLPQLEARLQRLREVFKPLG